MGNDLDIRADSAHRVRCRLVLVRPRDRVLDAGQYGDVMNVLKFVGIARAVSQMSKDPSTKVGALVLGSGMEIRAQGWNGFPRGVRDDPERLNDRPTKYKYVVHAEANAIANAARSGVSLDGCSLLVTELHPCNDCAKLIIQSGILKVYAPLPENDGRWADSFEVAATMFREAGVAVEFY